MPRIDPLQLIKCLSCLLSPDGGIKSKEEVPRLVNLMTKFSKKLVSKCVYLLILKSTESKLVDMFMSSGGWLLIHTWLQDALNNSNWDLVREILDLLILTPVDSPRLRLNNIPKHVKTISKRDDLGDVKEKAVLLVKNWLAILRKTVVQDVEQSAAIIPSPPIVNVKEEPSDVTNEIETVEIPEAPIEDTVKMEVDDEDTTNSGLYYKITVRDGKQVIKKLEKTESVENEPIVQLLKEVKPEPTEEKVKNSSSSSSKPSKSSSSSSSRKSSSSSSRSSSDKHKDRKSSSSSRHSSSRSSSSKSSSRDKDRDRSRTDKDKENSKDKHHSNGSLKSSSSSSRDKEKDKHDTKEKQADKDQETLNKIKPTSIEKLGRIPKKTSTSDDKNLSRKSTISIEPKKPVEDRPKTVKIFNSKMRSTGLEEEAKPPPPRNAVKKPPPVIPPVLPVKRPSPPREPIPVPEKKLKVDVPERVGAIKLIPPKPKVLQESDIFMDALTASSKKEPKKKKRRLSVSKESAEELSSPPPTNSPIALKNITPANFYQDTLENAAEETAAEAKAEETTEAASENRDDAQEENRSDNETVESNEPRTHTNADGLKGVLIHLKRKGPKKSIRWREEKDLVEVRYFELDENERVNVSRPNFNDMAKMEMCHEREALLARKLVNEDLMEPTVLWRIPYEVDQAEPPVQPGSKSLEKDIQYAREKNILQALYFNKNCIPDSPAEPIFENHPVVDPVIIPLDDPESQYIDLIATPWPEPKGLMPMEQPPPQQHMPNMAPMFPNMPAGPFPNFQPMGPQGFPGPGGMPPRFCPPNMMPGGPPMNMNMMNMGHVPPMDMIPQPQMTPNMFPPNVDNFNPMMNDNNQNFNMPFNQFGPPNNNNFNGPPRGRGGMFRRGNMNTNNWGRNNGQRGGGNWRNVGGGQGRFCKNVKNHGYCRNIDNCPFVHPS